LKEKNITKMYLSKRNSNFSKNTREIGEIPFPAELFLTIFAKNNKALAHGPI